MRFFHLLFLSFFLISFSHAQSQVWKINKSKTAVNFSIKNLGFDVDGNFLDYDGEVFFDEANPKNSKVNISISTTSLNTSSSARDKELRKKSIFDVANHPKMVFNSTKFEKKSENEYLVYGVLNIKGVKKNLVLKMKITERKQNYLNAMVETLVNRIDFGVGGKSTMIMSDEVRVKIPLQLIQ